jgi:hypothetical protein
VLTLFPVFISQKTGNHVTHATCGVQIANNLSTFKDKHEQHRATIDKVSPSNLGYTRENILSAAGRFHISNNRFLEINSKTGRDILFEATVKLQVIVTGKMFIVRPTGNLPEQNCRYLTNGKFFW